MKYGQALYERSVPQWAPYNIDYNELKSLIKSHTTPPPSSSHSNSSQPVVIPGQTDEALSSFEARFARELGAQHARVDLFVRSKADEFRRRLSDYEQKLNRLIARGDPESGGIMTARRRERLARLETRVLRCTDDIRNLDRFIQAQRIGFQKILKKYRKWTGSPTLPRLTDPFLSPTTSFTHLSLLPLLTAFTDLSARIQLFSPPPSSSSTPLTLSRRSSQPLPHTPVPARNKAVQTAAYWNEYDYPSDGGGADEPYTIAFDAADDETFPGQQRISRALAYIGEKTAVLGLWRPSSSGTASTKGERRALLGRRASEGETGDEEIEAYDAEGFPLGYETHYATFPSIATQRLTAQRSRFLLLALVACYISSALLLGISGILVATGRNRLRAEVDAGVIAGVVAALGFVGVGVRIGAMRWETARVWEKSAVVVGFVGGCLVGGGLLVGVMGQ
ncbi:hypothetical protein VE03_00973 [Pseudogymnoascus sp. 23342-1-I1]|nr:hypothetical protein VE03_00973 [Pseudogymnoascus sp. 23342-1-I1]